VELRINFETDYCSFTIILSGGSVTFFKFSSSPFSLSSLRCALYQYIWRIYLWHRLI